MPGKLIYSPHTKLIIKNLDNMNNKILVIGSSNTDMTIKGDRLPVPGQPGCGGKAPRR